MGFWPPLSHPPSHVPSLPTQPPTQFPPHSHRPTATQPPPCRPTHRVQPGLYYCLSHLASILSRPIKLATSKLAHRVGARRDGPVARFHHRPAVQPCRVGAMHRAGDCERAGASTSQGRSDLLPASPNCLLMCTHGSARHGTTWRARHGKHSKHSSIARRGEAAWHPPPAPARRTASPWPAAAHYRMHPYSNPDTRTARHVMARHSTEQRSTARISRRDCFVGRTRRGNQHVARHLQEGLVVGDRCAGV